METLKQRLNQATTNQEKETIIYNMMLAIKRKEQLNSINNDLLNYFAKLYIQNKLTDASGTPIRNIKQFLIKVNANKNISCEQWYNNLIEEMRKQARERDEQENK